MIRGAGGAQPSSHRQRLLICRIHIYDEEEERRSSLACPGNLCSVHKLSREANLLGALSLTVADRIRAAATASAPSSGEGPAGLVALATFMQGGSIEELSRVLGLSHSATVRLVDKLEGGELVERRIADDARAVAVVPTVEGVEIAEQIQGARLNVLTGLLDPLTSCGANGAGPAPRKAACGLGRDGRAAGEDLPPLRRGGLRA